MCSTPRPASLSAELAYLCLCRELSRTGLMEMTRAPALRVGSRRAERDRDCVRPRVTAFEGNQQPCEQRVAAADGIPTARIGPCMARDSGGIDGDDALLAHRDDRSVSAVTGAAPDRDGRIVRLVDARDRPVKQLTCFVGVDLDELRMCVDGAGQGVAAGIERGGNTGPAGGRDQASVAVSWGSGRERAREREPRGTFQRPDTISSSSRHVSAETGVPDS